MRHTEEVYDVIVCGGGLAGVCAAIASARNGSRTCILQDRPVFGGNSSSEIRVFPQGAANFHAYARETGIISELLIEERAVNHEPNQENGRTNSVWDMLLYDKVICTPNLSFHLNTTVYAVSKGNHNEVTSVLARVANAETEMTLSAQVFIDCTGDGIVAALAGCIWRMGTEGREEFGEPHAPEEASEEVMGSSIHFRAKDVGKRVSFQAPTWAFPYDNPDVFYKGGRVPHDPEGGFWWIELGVPWNTITENETIRHELTRHVLGIWDYMKNKDPELRRKTENYALDWIGQVPGKRESRRIVGQYMLTELDLLDRTMFEDEIAYGGWYIDLHKSGGLLADYSEQAAAEGHSSDYMKKSYVAPYGIPLRCLLAKDVPNLLLAGRNIGVTHVVLGSTRVMGTTAVLGQAAGTTAAIALQSGELVSQLTSTTLAKIKQQLLRDDAFLLHTANEDEADLARQATVKASSEATVGRAEPTSGGAKITTDNEEMLSELMGQWIAVSTEKLVAISVCVSNPSASPQWIKASIAAVDHIWDYKTDDTLKIASTKLEVPQGDYQWIRWELDLTLGVQPMHRYIRLELGPNTNVVWHSAKTVIPGMTAAYDLGTGSMRRYGNGVTMSFTIEPEQQPYPAQHVVSGVTRPYNVTNLWRSQPMGTDGPQWIDLMWKEPVSISKIQLTFAGNLLMDYRFYTPLTHEASVVKTYTVHAWVKGEWQSVVNVQGNYQRQRRHQLERKISTDKLRVSIHETNGDSCAAIYEVRVYGE